MLVQRVKADCVKSVMDTQTHTHTLLHHECQSGIQLDFMQSSAQNLRHLPGLIRFSSLAPNPSHPRFRSLLLRFINPCSSASFPKTPGSARPTWSPHSSPAALQLLIKNWKELRFISFGPRRVSLECYKTQSAVTCLQLSLKVGEARNLFCPCNVNTTEILQACGSSTVESRHRLPAKRSAFSCSCDCLQTVVVIPAATTTKKIQAECIHDGFVSS